MRLPMTGSIIFSVKCVLLIIDISSLCMNVLISHLEVPAWRSLSFLSDSERLLDSIPLERQYRTMLAALRLVHQCEGDRICVQGSIVLAQPSPDLIEQRFDLITRDRSIETTGIDQRSEQPQRPVELCHPLGMKLHPNPPASSSCLFKSLDDSIRRRGGNLQARCQLFHCLVMHGQYRIQIWPIECTPPAHRYRKS